VYVVAACFCPGGVAGWWSVIDGLVIGGDAAAAAETATEPLDQHARHLVLCV